MIVKFLIVAKNYPNTDPYIGHVLKGGKIWF